MIQQAVKSEGNEATEGIIAKPGSTIKTESTPASCEGDDGREGVFARELSDRVPGRKRAATFQRKYANALKAIEHGQITPEVKPIAGHVQCSTRTASSILAKAVESDDRFARDTRGRVRFKAAA